MTLNDAITVAVAEFGTRPDDGVLLAFLTAQTGYSVTMAEYTQAMQQRHQRCHKEPVETHRMPAHAFTLRPSVQTDPLDAYRGPKA